MNAPKSDNPGVVIQANGLRRHVLGPLEAIAQSVSTMAPTASAALTIPLVFASAGNGTWLAYLIAMACTLPVALCVARFAGESSSPGSLYTYSTSSLPPTLGSVAAWSLVLAYVATAASVVGGFIHYANVVLGEFLGRSFPAAPLGVFAVAGSVWFAYRDIKASAQLMLYIEVVSVVLISAVFSFILWKHGLHIDPVQTSLHGVNVTGLRLAVVLAIFSYAGFESATTLGEEVREPLRTVPRAIIQTSILTGLFFVTASYVEVLGFPASAGALDQSDAPMSVLATEAGLRPLGRFIDFGVMVTMLACTLACITAAARVLMLMGTNGLAPRSFAATHPHNHTPHIAIFASGAVTMVLSVALALGKVSGDTIYDWMGSLAVYGFVVVYALVAVALPIHLKKLGKPILGAIVLAVMSVLAMALVLEGTLYPIPEAPKNLLPYYFLLYLVVAAVWNGWNAKSAAAKIPL